MRRLVRLAVVAASIALIFWLLWGWWPIGYTPFVKVGTEGSAKPPEYSPFVSVGSEG